jgi:hypothetical protein
MAMCGLVNFGLFQKTSSWFITTGQSHCFIPDMFFYYILQNYVLITGVLENRELFAYFLYDDIS